MKKVHFDKHRCKGCGLCVMFCPKKTIRMSTDLNEQGLPYPAELDPDNCTGCGICFRMCPDTAVKVNKDGLDSEKNDEKQ